MSEKVFFLVAVDDLHDAHFCHLRAFGADVDRQDWVVLENDVHRFGAEVQLRERLVERNRRRINYRTQRN